MITNNEPVRLLGNRQLTKSISLRRIPGSAPPQTDDADSPLHLRTSTPSHAMAYARALQTCVAAEMSRQLTSELNYG
ncbi:hypothetical protein FHL15_010683 [Xylaria flabelliformis]|uniref:Uncharacterized protein n=1 Tax=Xylaria flabelliformis TaxID=2512241 RepID=A0A553HKE8_9PEZI|nr:hypothetical protein FHL15_010683 [Xylaria flabelliformis]